MYFSQFYLHIRFCFFFNIRNRENFEQQRHISKLIKHIIKYKQIMIDIFLFMSREKEVEEALTQL